MFAVGRMFCDPERRKHAIFFRRASIRLGVIFFILSIINLLFYFIQPTYKFWPWIVVIVLSFVTSIISFIFALVFFSRVGLIVFTFFLLLKIGWFVYCEAIFIPNETRGHLIASVVILILQSIIFLSFFYLIFFAWRILTWSRITKADMMEEKLPLTV